MKLVMSRVARLCLQAFLAVVLVAALAGAPVSAHAVLVSSTPKDGAVLKVAPKSVTLRFASRIEKRIVKVSLTDAKGKPVKLTTPAGGYKTGPANKVTIPMPNLKPDTYRLQYQVLATDGHITPGAIRFTVQGRKAP